MIQPSLTSLDLYLLPDTVPLVETREIRDVACGRYPVYYHILSDGTIRVACSTTALVSSLGDLQLNPRFQPPDFLVPSVLPSVPKPSWFRRFPATRIPLKLCQRILPPTIVPSNCYPTWETIDHRIHKLRPFQTVGPKGSSIHFQPDYSLDNTETLARQVACHMRFFVRTIEERFPGYDHIVLTGGKDSQLIHLVPKQVPTKWHVFSGDPNFPLVKQWLENNDITVGRLIRHDDANHETRHDLVHKLICSDLRSDPHHVRYLPFLTQLSREFDRRCIFWSGSIGDALHAYHPAFHRQGRKGYFRVHFQWVASSHAHLCQTFRNFVHSPLLSIYHSEHIWADVYQHLDPRLLTPGLDLRNRIGEILAGRPIKWNSQNPGPTPYQYDLQLNSYQTYLEYIQKQLTQNRSTPP